MHFIGTKNITMTALDVLAAVAEDNAHIIFCQADFHY